METLRSGQFARLEHSQADVDDLPGLSSDSD